MMAIASVNLGALWMLNAVLLPRARRVRWKMVSHLDSALPRCLVNHPVKRVNNALKEYVVHQKRVATLPVRLIVPP